MAAFALVFAALAALLHFYIFYLEVPAFGSAAFCRVFRIAPEQLPDVQAAFQNLGVYNLCLALCLCAGIGARLLSGGSAYALGLSHGFLCSGLGSIIVAGCAPPSCRQAPPCWRSYSCCFPDTKAACTPVFKVQAAFFRFGQCGKFNESPPSSHRPQSPCR